MHGVGAWHKLDLIHLSSSGKTQGSGQSACGHTRDILMGSPDSGTFCKQLEICNTGPIIKIVSCNKDAILVFSKDSKCFFANAIISACHVIIIHVISLQKSSCLVNNIEM